jgi:hypothetical protein
MVHEVDTTDHIIRLKDISDPSQELARDPVPELPKVEAQQLNVLNSIAYIIHLCIDQVTKSRVFFF